MSKLIHIDQDYKQWILSVSKRFRRRQMQRPTGEGVVLRAANDHEWSNLKRTRRTNND